MTSNRIGDADVLDSVLNQDIDKIRRTLEETSHQSFYDAVDAIVSARKIYILSARSASALGLFLNYYFSLIFDQVELVTTTSKTEIYEKMFRINDKDVVIGISFPRYSKQAVNAMNFAKKKGAKGVALTDSMLSPLAGQADYVLLARSDMASVVDSLVAPLSLINAIIVATALKKKDQVSETFQNLEDIWDEYEVYEKVEEDSVESGI